jgi:uncharacterized protein (DUF1015 family)
MPQLLPLRGIRYTSAAGSFGDVLAPPYDVISAAQQRQLLDQNAHNAVRLELSEGGEERYARVADLLAAWLEEGILARDGAPTLYVYEQEFEFGGRKYERRGVMAGVEAQPWEEGAVKPHEYTMSGPKEDRLKLLQATRTQFSPVFMIARDRAGQLAQFIEGVMAEGPPAQEGRSLEGDVHRLWLVEAGPLEMRRLAPLFAESFYIADGHHRYETAVTYRNWLSETQGALRVDHPARFALSVIVPAGDPGLLIRPIHRLVPKAAPGDWRERLRGVFEIDRLERAREAEGLESALAQDAGAIVAIGLEAGRAHVLRARADANLAALAPAGHSAEWAAVAPNLLRLAVLNPLWSVSDEDLRAGMVTFLHDVGDVLNEAGTDGERVGFLLNPVSVRETLDLADKGERMPQKSTFFHPKMGTGLVLHPLYP